MEKHLEIKYTVRWKFQRIRVQIFTKQKGIGRWARYVVQRQFSKELSLQLPQNAQKCVENDNIEHGEHSSTRETKDDIF